MIRCLIVDDEPLALHILEDYISKVPFMELVRSTTNPIEALTLVQEGNIDLVFLDVQMPGMDGYEVARHLKEDAGARQVTLIALTGYGQPEDIRRAKEAGFDHHLVKPVEPELVASLINANHANPDPQGTPVAH